jgi:hypothetical protein
VPPAALGRRPPHCEQSNIVLGDALADKALHYPSTKDLRFGRLDCTEQPAQPGGQVLSPALNEPVSVQNKNSVLRHRNVCRRATEVAHYSERRVDYDVGKLGWSAKGR